MDMLRRLFGERRAAIPSRRSPGPVRARCHRTSRRWNATGTCLRTAPPETIEEAHAEAFAKLTPEQRRMVLQELDSTLTPAERAAGADL